MTYTLVFRVTREVWDAMEAGKKKEEYRNNSPFWRKRMEMARYFNQGPEVIRALFLCGARKAIYGIVDIRLKFAEQVPAPWDRYIGTEKIWAVELGERIEP